MSKRPCPFDENGQDIKRQIGDEYKTRGIRSSLSEKTLQLLYKGASKQFLAHVDERKKIDANYICLQCSAPLYVKSKCFYCDKLICATCMSNCLKCDEDFCKNCSFPNYSDSSTVCYSCY